MKVPGLNISEFKRRMGHHLSRVRAGQSITLLDRGRPVARVSPLEEQNDRLVVIPAAVRDRNAPAPPRVRARGPRTSLDVLSDDRAE